jgi:FkbM family methyltransferase
MHFLHKLRRLFERVTHTRIYRRPPRGIDLGYDLAHALPGYRVETVFDVGANVGQSTKDYLRKFPDARIYSFEPVRSTFQQLEANLTGQNRVRCFQLAFGALPQQGTMVLEGKSVMFFLSGESRPPPKGENVITEQVEVATLDEFCRKHQVDRVSYIKIDTEGGDMNVLKGAEHLLAEQRIDLVQLEAGMNVHNTWHVALETLKQHLESRNYFLFGVYEQVNEWPAKEPQLRRANPVFISRRMIEAHRGA